jgi:hypothetical protein
MEFIGNYHWLKKLKTIYGPVSLHMCDISFKYNKKTIRMHVLLMGDLHTNTPNIKETETTYKLSNFILNIIRTNKRCFDLFIEAYSPHIANILKYKRLNPNKKSLPTQTKTKTKTTTKTKHKTTNKTSNNVLSVGTDKSQIRDTRDYKIPLIALRNSPYLIGCRYHNIKKYNNNYCKFQNVRYHSWDLRFTNVETDLTILSELTMTYDNLLYNYFEEYGISGHILTQFLMFRKLGDNLEDKIKRLFFMFYEKIKNKVKQGVAPENVEELFQTINVNADYSFYNFDKQKKLVNKQFNKIPTSLKQQLLKSFIKIYNKPHNYPLAITDFYTICRMLSKFKFKKNKPETCHNSEYSFCQNIIYYAGGQHSQLILEVILDMFGNKTLKYTTGTEYIKTKRISINSFKGKNKQFPHLKKPLNFLDIVSAFYRQ